MSAMASKGVGPRKLPFTGKEYLESLRDDREVWIYGERVKDVTTHSVRSSIATSAARTARSPRSASSS